MAGSKEQQHNDSQQAGHHSHCQCDQSDAACQHCSNTKRQACSNSLTDKHHSMEHPSSTEKQDKDSDVGSAVMVTPIHLNKEPPRALSTVSTKSNKSIYHVHTRSKRGFILALVSLASLLVPFTDTVYLPALQAIQIEFSTTQQLVAASVAVYMFTVGLASLVWGPASDRYGRKRVYFASTAAFLATSLVCIFAPNIGVLVAFRALQGAAVAAYGATGSGTIADAFAPHERGTALGISTIPMLVGPILGPILGGALSQAFGWRSTFITVTMYAGIVILPMLFFLPETHHFKRLIRIQKRNPEAAAEIQEASVIFDTPPVFQAPWFPLAILLEKDVVLHALVALLLFGSMFCSITELPLYLAQPPYNLSAAMIGLCYIPNGVAGILASPLGGMLSDKVAKAHTEKPLVRLMYNNIVSGIMLPLSLVLYGWSVQFKLHLAVVLVAQFFVGVGLSLYLPAIFGYLTAIKQQVAAAAAAGVHSMMFIASGVLILVASAATSAMGMGPFFTMLAGLNILTTGAAAVQIFRHKEKSKENGRAASRLQLSEAAAGAAPQNSTADVETGSA